MTNINSNTEIDLKNILNILLRNSAILIIFTLISTFSVFSYWRLQGPIWKGNFNILVKNNKRSGDTTATLDFVNTAFMSGLKVNEDAETQRLILRSPMILNSVYKEVIDYYNKNSAKNNLTFSSWISKIKIEYENGSKILNISHTNEDKVLLLKTLELIAEKYKEYSKKEQIKTTKKTKDYLISQIEIMQKKAFDSKKSLDNFSIENNLGVFDGLISTANKSNQTNDIVIKNGEPNTIPINSNSTTKFAGSRFESQFRLLQRKEAQFFNLSQFLKPTSETLSILQQRIEFLKNSIKRPTEILIKYEELAEESLRDANLLTALRDSLEIIKLEEIKTPDPWQLVSDPIIEELPISYTKKEKLYISLLGSLIAGCILVLIKDRYTGKIFTKSYFSSRLTMIDYIETLNRNFEDLSLRLVNNSIRKNKTKNKDEMFGFINYDSKSDLGFMEKYLIKNPNIMFLNIDEKKIDDCEKLFLVLEKGKLTHSDFDLIIKYVSLYQEKICGWFYIC